MQINGQFKFGSYTGDGAAQTITCGFKPICVLVYNETDGDTLWLHLQGLADAKALQITNHADTQLSLLAANGITLSASGFTIGTSLSESAKVMRYLAF
jgi:hypothetical protein